MSRPAAVLLLLFCTAIWGLAFVAQKSAMDTIGALTFTGVRFIIGGLLILPLSLLEYRRHVARSGDRLTLRQWLLILALGAVFFMGSALQQLGLALTTVTNSGFLTALYVLFAPLVAFAMLRTRPHPVIYVGVPLALTGIYCLNGGLLGGFNSGDLLVVTGALFWGMHVVLLGFLARETRLPVFVSGLTFLIAGVAALTLAFLFESPSLEALSVTWVQLAYVAVFSTAIAFTGQAIAQQYVPAANAAIILSAESLFAALGGALLLGERLSIIGYFGAALIFLAIIAVEAVPALRPPRPAPSPGRLRADPL